MLSSEDIPVGFKVFCTTPELKIRYSEPTQAGCCLMLVFVPFFVIFFGHIKLLFLLFYKILNIGIVQVMQKIVENIKELWQFPLSFLLFGAATFIPIWSAFGITDFLATNDSLIVSKKLFWISKHQEIRRINIQYFQQFKDVYEGESILYPLKLITNQKNPNGNISVVIIDTLSIETGNWLGNVLADFYSVEFHPYEKK